MSDKPEQQTDESVDASVEETGGEIATTTAEDETGNTESSDTAENPVKEKSSEQPAKKRRGLPWFGIFNFLLILGLVAAAAYYWQLQQKTEAEKQAAFDALKQQVSSKAETSQLQTSIRPLESGLSELINRLEQLQKHQQELQESSEKLYELFGRDENAWQLAEVEYLMRIAQHKLILENDFEGAAVTLQAASDRIATTGDMGLLPVRVKISDEIAELKTRRRPDLVGMTLKLAQLGQQVRYLKPGFKVENLPSSSAEVKSGEPDPNIRQRVVDFFKSLVSVKRDVEMAPTKTEALVINVPEKLEDNLKLSRWSVLERDAFQYKRLMKENVELFSQFYNLDDAANNDFYSQLLTLQQAELKPEKPDISGSLDMLRKIISKREQNEEQLDSGEVNNG